MERRDESKIFKWKKRIVYWWKNREERWEDNLLSRLPANEQDEEIRRFIDIKRRLRRDLKQAELHKKNSETLRKELNHVSEQIDEMPTTPSTNRDRRKLSNLKQENARLEKELAREETRLETVSKTINSRSKELESFGFKNLVGRSAQTFRLQFAAASGVVATLTIGGAGLLATTTGADNWTTSHIITLTWAILGIGAALIFHAIPLAFHFLDWRLAMSGKIHSWRGSYLAGRDKQIVSIQAIFLMFQIFAWIMVVKRIFQHLMQ